MNSKKRGKMDTNLPGKITRRDFVHGLGGLSMSALIPGVNLQAQDTGFVHELEPGYYPPSQMGLRGSHAGSFEVAHSASWQEGKAWDDARDIDQDYDLVVVGGGISGLASAYYYQQANPGANILILENHDDFGGHAKRVEFNYEGASYLSGGGSFFMSHELFSQPALDLVRDIGIDIDTMLAGQPKGDFRQKSYGLKPSVFFDQQSYGVSATVTGDFNPFSFNDKEEVEGFLATLEHMPFQEKTRADFRRLLTEEWDCLPGLSPEHKQKKLASISYSDFLVNYVGTTRELVDYFNRFMYAGAGGMGADYTPAVVPVSYLGMPGKNALVSKPGDAGDDHAADPGHEYLGAYFPEGNAGIARLLVAKLIPDSVEATDMTNILDSRVDYGNLDRPDSAVRVRLNSTVTNVTEGSGRAPVNVTYVRDGNAFRVKARHCVLAGYSMMIPYICPQLPKTQGDALAKMVKVPMMSASVLLRNGEALKNIGSAYYYAPGKTYVETMGSERSLGEHEFTFDPAKPVPLYMIGSHLGADIDLVPQEQYRRARAELLTASFEDLAHDVTAHLDEMLSPGGFSSERDIAALVVNRWPHGYAYGFKGIHDGPYGAGETPYLVGRQRFGSIAIANSDAGGKPLANEAIDQAYRAVNELLG